MEKVFVEPWVDASVIAAHLGFKEDHIRKLARAGKIPGKPMQNGRRVYWRFRISAVDAAMEDDARQTIHIAMPVLSACVEMAGQA